MERTGWTDERIDDTVANLNQTLALLREDIGMMRAEMHQEFRAIRADLAATQRQQTRFAFALAVSVLGLLGVLLAASL